MGCFQPALGFASQKLSKQELEKEEIDVKEQGKPLKSDQSNTLLNQNDSNVWRNHLPDSKIVNIVSSQGQIKRFWLSTCALAG